MSDAETMILRGAMVGMAAALVLTAAGLLLINSHPSGPSVSPPTYIYHNSTVFENKTIYVNTTQNVSQPHWQNTTVYVNTTQVEKTTNTIYRNTTVYVNTTFVRTIPVVNVTGVFVNFTSPSLGTNYTVPTPTNYSLPIGTVTWIQFTLNETMCGGGYSVSVNSPWTLLSASDWSTPKVITVDVLLGVPYFPGTYPILVTVSK